MKTSVIEVHDMLSVWNVDEVEKQIGGVPGVESVTVNFAAGSATVRYDETRLEVADIKTAVRQRGYESAAPSGDSANEGHEGHAAPGAPPATPAPPVPKPSPAVPVVAPAPEAAPMPDAAPDAASKSDSAPVPDAAPDAAAKPDAAPAAAAGDKHQDKANEDTTSK